MIDVVFRVGVFDFSGLTRFTQNPKSQSEPSIYISSSTTLVSIPTTRYDTITQKCLHQVCCQDQDQVFLLVATNLRAQAEFNPRAFHGVVAAPDASVYRRRKSPVTGLPLPQQRGGRECGHRLLPSRDEWGAHLASTSPPLPWSPGGDMAPASFPPPGISGPGYTGHPSWVSRLGQSFLKVGTAAAVR